MPDSRPPGLWRNRNWRLLFAGESVSLTGDFVFYVTVLLWIATIIAKGQPWAPAAASGALIATAAPVLVIGPIAGVFVDRWNRRRTMLIADAARALLIASLLVVPTLRHHIPVGAQLAILYAVLAACSCFAQFFDPSRLAVLGDIVSEDQQSQASALLSASASMAQILGPPIAAPLLVILGVQWALIINAASFAISFVCVRAISVPLEAAPDAHLREGFAAEFKTGLRFFVRNRVLLALGIGIVIAMLGNGAINSLSAFFVPHNLHVAASWLGTIIGSVGIGAVIGALLTGMIAKRFAPSQLFSLSLVICGASLIALSRASDLGAAIAAATVIGFGTGILNSVISPMILSSTPSSLLGRVSAVLSPVQQLASIVSMVLAGVLASTILRGFHAEVLGVHFGQYDTVFFAGGLLFMLGGTASIALLRKDRKAEPEPTGPGHTAPEPAELVITAEPVPQET
jgi:MFS family permease